MSIVNDLGQYAQGRDICKLNAKNTVMILKRSFFFLFVLLAFSVGNAVADDNAPWWYWGPNCVYYFNREAPLYPDETIRTDQSTEEVNGRTYYVVTVTLWGRSIGSSGERPATKENVIHIRKDGQRILLVYTEYKQLMQDRGYDMTNFDEQCQYEVTGDGEMVLYDFGMQVGDKFRSVPGKEDVFVVSRGKEPESSYYTRQDTLDIITLSNGVKLIEGVGYKTVAEEGVNVTKGTLQGQYFDYLNLYADDYGKVLYSAKWNGDYICEWFLDGSSTGIQTVETTQSPASLASKKQYFDLQGRHQTGQPQQGIYIRNGKKAVIK